MSATIPTLLDTDSPPPSARTDQQRPIASAVPITQQHHVTKVHPKTKRTFKVIIIGDPNVGKTCLSFRFCNGRFPEKTEATIGVDFRERQVIIDNDLLKVQLWDTAGQERFRQSMVAHYYRNVQAVVYVYDVTKLQTFKNISHWISECVAHSVSPDVPKLLIGNKCDMPDDKREVSVNEAQKFADRHDMPLFETSAKKDSEADHVESIFMTLILKLKNSKHTHVMLTEEEMKRRNNVLNVEQTSSGDQASAFSACNC